MTRTTYLIFGLSQLTITLLVSLLVRFMICISENWTKDRLILQPGLDRYTRFALANVWTRICQLWIVPLFQAGASRSLVVEDLSQHYRNQYQDEDCERLEAGWNKRNSLLLASFEVFKWYFLGSAVPGLVSVACLLCQPELISRFVRFTASYATMQPQAATNGWILVSCFLLVHFVGACAFITERMIVNSLETRLWAAVASLVYKKTLTASIDSGIRTSGQASTYISSDVASVGTLCSTINSTWQNSVIIIIAFYFLFSQIGLAAFAAVAITAVCLSVPVVLGKFISSRRTTYFVAEEARISQITSFIQKLKAIKLQNNQGRVVRPLIARLRAIEMKALIGWCKFLILSVFWGAAMPLLIINTAFTAYAMIHLQSGHDLTIHTTFTSLSLLTIIVTPVCTVLQLLPSLFNARASLSRLQNFLSTTHKSRAHLANGSSSTTSHVSATACTSSVDMPKDCVSEDESLSLLGASLRWGHEQNDLVFKDVSLTILPHKFTCIVGYSGCGKTFLLKSMLGETALLQGQRTRPNVPIAFCEQNPWIESKSIRDNIVGMHLFDLEWYNRILLACDLTRDLDILCHGDNTMVGSNGQILSGGQRQRLALARALYSRVSIYFFDDSFSAIDRVTADHIFQFLFRSGGLLHNKTVVLVTHDLSRLSSADWIVMVSDFKIVEQGAWSEIQLSNGHIASLVRETKTSLQVCPTTELPEAMDAHVLTTTQQILSFTFEAVRYVRSFAIFSWYFGLVGYRQVSSVLILSCLEAVSSVGPQLWLSFWSIQASASAEHTVSYYIEVLWALFGAWTMIWLTMAYSIFVVWTEHGGTKAHAQLLDGLLGAKMSFFDKNPAGTIINRFSQDISSLDFDSPISILNVGSAGASTLVQIVLVCIAVPYMTVALPFLMGLFYLIQKYYLKTSRQVKTIALESKTPLYNSILESLEGLATIRAGKLGQAYIEHNKSCISSLQPSMYLSAAVSSTLEFVLKTITTILVTCLTTVVVLTRNSASSGLVGLALVQLTALYGNLEDLLCSFVSLEIDMVAAERVYEYVKLPQEDSRHGHSSSDWLTNGRIEYKSVSAKYADDDVSPMTLQDISFVINSGEKIGICGRTGSGKSSLILTLFRAMDFVSGQIVIDDTDINSLTLDSLRDHLTIVTQNPALWLATIRDNIDPEHKHVDLEIWACLGRVQLADHIKSLENGLDHLLLEGGMEFSAGQQQLLCLARACLRQSKIVVLDEATSSMDLVTDRLVQETIRTTFSEATVLTIAHRIETIRDHDKIMVLDKGRLVEFDTPGNLLRNPTSRLHNMRVSVDTKKIDVSSNN